ncbi:MAG TPA: hypothetical protein VN701_00375 [Candidatus Paceibacterota bacterium]|nr:hypothetical protein [Candidatus Paceibacterota bacterium]
MTMNITQALEDARVSSRPHGEYDPKLLAHIARAALEKERAATRRLASLGIILFAVIFVGLLVANIYEQSHMTERQAETIEHIVN